MTRYLEDKIRRDAVLVSEGMACAVCQALCPQVALKCDELYDVSGEDCESIWRLMMTKVIEESEDVSVR